MATDGYDFWYADKLWRLLPAVYRSLDAAAEPSAANPYPAPGPLRELLGRIGTQAATVRRSMDRLWEDQSIETCDDWVIPYIGDLLATRMVSCLDARGQRLDVARTIYYRRRSGTVGLLEELAADIAGHDARVVEFFRRMGRTRHQFDPPIGPVQVYDRAAPPTLAVVEGLVGTYTRTPAGGYADLRNVYGASNAGNAFDEFAYTADFRRGRQSLGHHNIPRLGAHIWWLYSVPITGATPVERAGCPGQFTFDPTGREIPLFAPSSRSSEAFGEHWVAPDEWRLPTPVRDVLWDMVPDELYASGTDANAFSIEMQAGPTPSLVDRADLVIDPEAGRFRFAGPRPPGPVGANYHFGFSSQIGAGGFDARILAGNTRPVVTASVSKGTGLDAALAALAANGTLELADSTTFPGPAANLSLPTDASALVLARNGARPVIRWTAANASWTITGNGGSLDLQGLYFQGADIVLAGHFDTVRLRLCTLDPGTSGAGETPPALFGTTIDALPLKAVTLFVEGQIGTLILERCITGPIRARNGGDAETLAIADSIVQSIPSHDSGTAGPLFDPANLAARAKLAADPAVAPLRAALPAAALTALDNWVPGGKPPAAVINALKAAIATLDPAALEKTFPLALADLALAFGGGTVSLVRTTVLGPTYTHRLAASECILDDLARVEDPQQGCVRFSAYAWGSQLHAPYRCVPVRPRGPLFETRLFGRPSYARLRRDADTAIVASVPPVTPAPSVLTGAQNGAEPGAFSLERVALKRRGLGQKYEEFMPIGLTPVWIDAD